MCSINGHFIVRRRGKILRFVPYRVWENEKLFWGEAREPSL
jgi:hypothetical protein